MEPKIILLPDNKIKPTHFVPHKFLVDTYYAHPDTIRAVKKEIFFDPALIDLPFAPTPKPCRACQQMLDKVFWNFCPFCGSNDF